MITYELSISDNAIQLNNIGMSELGHDGCFLQKLDLSTWLGYCRIESLDGNSRLPLEPFHIPIWTQPNYPSPSILVTLEG